MLIEKSKKIKISLYNFKFFGNDEVMSCNKSFYYCLSQIIFQAVSIDASLKEYRFKDIQIDELFIFFFNILFGESF
jgi:hypothetical protein